MPHGPNKMLLIYQLLSYPRDLNFREKIGGDLLSCRATAVVTNT